MRGQMDREISRSRLAGILSAGLALFLSSSLLGAQERGSKPPAQAPVEANDARVALRTEVVSLEVSVTDSRGRFIAGLAKEDFQIFDDGVRQEITHFSQSDAPATVGIVFDLSGSMSEGRIERARDALAHLLETTHSEDEFFLISCGARPAVLVDRTRDGGSLINRMASLKASGHTALFDSVALALDKVTAGRHRKRALVVISDGEENHSRLSFKELRRRLHEADVSVWTVLTGPLRPKDRGGAIMDELASTSGGRSFFPRNDEKMVEAFAQIALELRHRYSLGFTPAHLAADGRWHRLKVTVDSPSLSERPRVRARAGYYAPHAGPSA